MKSRLILEQSRHVAGLEMRREDAERREVANIIKDAIREQNNRHVKATKTNRKGTTSANSVSPSRRDISADTSQQIANENYKIKLLE